MSETLATSSADLAAPSAGGIVCCPSDLRAQIPTGQLPWFRLIVGLFVAVQTMALGMTLNLTAPEDRTTLLLLQGGMLAATLVVMALLGVPLLLEATRQLLARRLTMELLFLVGILSTLALSVWSMIRGAGPVYFEVISVLLVVYSLGRTITTHSRAKALAATGAMLQEVAQARRADGQIIEVTGIHLGDRVRIVPGELIPVDGVVIGGQSLVRTTAFSGEWLSGVRQAGDTVMAGTACEDGTLVVEATSDGLDRRIDRLAALITSACQSTSAMQQLSDGFVRLFLPAVMLVAAGTFAYWSAIGQWSAGLFNALSVILVACPCAAGLATPLATWSAIGRLASRGLLLKSAQSIHQLATVDSVIFDKTGTLADDRLQLDSLTTAPDPLQRQRALAILREVERHSDHPIARVLRELPTSFSGLLPVVQSVQTLPGRGIEAEILLNHRPATLQLLRRENADALTIDATLDGLWIATASFTEHLRKTAPFAIQRLEATGLPVQIMTGDSSSAASRAGVLAPITSGMTPEAKHQATRGRTGTLFIGDGVNDAAAMAASHCSIAMATGAAITTATADATLFGDNMALIPEAILLARRTLATIRSNFAWAVTYNLVGMILAATGWLHPVVAAILMSLSSGLVAWRSLRLRGTPPAATNALNRVGAMDTDDSQSPCFPSLPLWAYASAHTLGFVGQALLLIPIARLGLGASAVAVGTAVLMSLLTVRFARHLPPWLDMTLAMLSVGGLGMNLGWWIDLRFGSAMREGMVALCCVVRTTADAGESHWMYGLMLLLGVPAMYLLRRGPLFFDYRKWCCTGMLLLGVPGMCFGMWAGAQLAMGLPDLSPQSRVLAAFVLMDLGMCVGMLIPHALELALPHRRATPTG